jgi:uncharacterized protein with ParB-like and HNH nuclease domain
MKKSVELNEFVEEIKDILKNIVDPITEIIEIEDDIVKSIDPKPEDLTDEEISKSYESDNEDEDKWDNMEKACWSGYKQVGMKDKGGKRVPNCVPIKKSLFGTDGPQTLVPKNKQ